MKNYSGIISRETIRLGLKYLDLKGVGLRAKKRNRNSTSYGSKDIIHICGFDKPKPFGICIHGSIDGYSQKVVWLEVCWVNNNPFVTKLYHVNYLRSVSKSVA